MRVFPTEVASSVSAYAQRWSRTNPIRRELKATIRKDQTIGAVMADGLNAPSVYPTAHSSVDETVIGFDALYESARKCWKGVSHKHSAQSYNVNILANTLKLGKELANGKYKAGDVRKVEITYPKPRTAYSITYRDRVYQRSINDNSLYPQVVRRFIYQNYACQKGKGAEAALQYFKSALHRAYLKYGSADFYILSCDVRKYYDSMVHSVTDRIIRESVDKWTADKVCETLSRQYAGDRGYNPGSQMVQIAGIAYLNELDHFIKETLRIKIYVRYMDDFHIVLKSREELEEVKAKVAVKLGEVGMELHPDKTRIRSARSGVVFLGFKFVVTDSGKVLMFRDPQRVKEIRRRLVRLAHKIERGDAEISDLDTSYQCVRACMAKGNSARLLRNMDAFVKELKEGINARTHCS